MSFLPLKKLVGKRVSVNVHGRFKYFDHCHMQGRVIKKNKVLLQEPLALVIDVKPEDLLPVPSALPNNKWTIGQKALVQQCIDSYWTWWEATIVKRANKREWTVKWAGEYQEYTDEANVAKELIANA